MPGKKEQIALQKEVSNQEQWEELLSTEGVIVIDVYQKWCGPCNAVVSLFRRMKNETGDELLKLAVAEADGIDALEKYRGQCQPCFLFYAGGQLVHVIRGVQGPSLVKAIIGELEAEHRYLDGGAQRKVVVDPLLAEQAAKERARSAADDEAKKKASAEAMNEELEGLGLGLRPVSQDTMDTLTSSFPSSGPVNKEVTVVVIKPDAVQAGKKDEILERLASLGLEILAQEERILSEEEARAFYKAQEGEDHFESLVQFMSSGPCHILVVTKGDTGQGVVNEVRSVLGPKDITVAKEESPESLRALFGTDTTMNALHGADSAEMAARELTFFFPDFVVPTVPGTGSAQRVEKTLALIRPEALSEHRDEILEKIQQAGFEVCLQKEVQLTEQQARDFYKEHEGEPFYEELVTEMIKGPVLALGLAREAAIQGWRNMLGPKEVDKAKEEAPGSLRAQFSSTGINAVHGSDSTQSAQKELEFFFPKEHTMAVIKPDAADEHKDAIVERLHEAGFNIASEKHMSLSREMAAQLYQEHEGKEFYDSLLDHMTSGPSTVLLLHREDAVHGLRALMGPADPDLAREQAPESFRALLGKDILQNAIHGSSSLDHVNKKLEHFFPEVHVSEDGQIVVPEIDQTDADEGEASVAGEGEDGHDEGDSQSLSSEGSMESGPIEDEDDASHTSGEVSGIQDTNAAEDGELSDGREADESEDHELSEGHDSSGSKDKELSEGLERHTKNIEELSDNQVANDNMDGGLPEGQTAIDKRGGELPAEHETSEEEGDQDGEEGTDQLDDMSSEMKTGLDREGVGQAEGGKDERDGDSFKEEKERSTNEGEAEDEAGSKEVEKQGSLGKNEEGEEDEQLGKTVGDTKMAEGEQLAETDASDGHEDLSGGGADEEDRGGDEDGRDTGGRGGMGDEAEGDEGTAQDEGGDQPSDEPTGEEDGENGGGEEESGAATEPEQVEESAAPEPSTEGQPEETAVKEHAPDGDDAPPTEDAASVPPEGDSAPDDSVPPTEAAPGETPDAPQDTPGEGESAQPGEAAVDEPAGGEDLGEE